VSTIFAALAKSGYCDESIIAGEQSRGIPSGAVTVEDSTMQALGDAKENDLLVIFRIL
jgi:hypothetical protein